MAFCQHSPFHDTSILYCRKTEEAEAHQGHALDDPLQGTPHQLGQGERGKYWKSMLEEEEDYQSKLRPPASRRPQTARQLTPRGSPTPMLGDFMPHPQPPRANPHASMGQNLMQRPKLPSPPSMMLVRQLPSTTSKPLRASISDTALTGHQQHHHHQYFYDQRAFQPPQPDSIKPLRAPEVEPLRHFQQQQQQQQPQQPPQQSRKIWQLQQLQSLQHSAGMECGKGQLSSNPLFKQPAPKNGIRVEPSQGVSFLCFGVHECIT